MKKLLVLILIIWVNLTYGQNWLRVPLTRSTGFNQDKSITFSKAHTNLLGNYNPNPLKPFVLPDSLKNYAAVIEAQYHLYEYVFNDDFVGYRYIEYKRYYINSQQAVDYLKDQNQDLGNLHKLVSYKTRLTLPNGQTEEISRTAADAITYNNRPNLRLAIPKLERNARLEIYSESFVSMNLQEVVDLSAPYPSLETEFALISPPHVFHNATAVRSEVKPITDQVNDTVKIIKLNIGFIPPKKLEPLSNLANDGNKIIFNFTNNLLLGNGQQVTWSDLGRSLLGNIASEELLKKYIPTIKNIIKEQGIENLTQLEKLRFLEDYLKTRCTISSYYKQEVKGTLSDHLSQKTLTHSNLLTALIAIAEHLQVNYQLLTGPDRNTNTINKSITSPEILEHYYLYFPDHKLYMNNQGDNRISITAPEFICSEVLSVTRKQMGENYFALTSFIQVPQPNPLQNTDTIWVDAQLTTNLDTLVANYKRKLTGLKGMEALHQLNASGLSTEDYIIGRLNLQERFLVKISGFEIIHSKPTESTFITSKAIIKSVDLVQKANQFLLINLASLIGNQTYLPEDSIRTSLITPNVANAYHRKLKLKIPDGYTHIPTESDNFIFQANGNSFDVKTTLNGQTLTIDCNEIYNSCDLKPTEYPSITKIYNAANSFSNSMLVLKKK